MILTKMQALKDETKMTYQDIADKSGVPLSTVKRIFSGRTPDRGVTTVIAIVEAMGASKAEDAYIVAHRLGHSVKYSLDTYGDLYKDLEKEVLKGFKF